MIRLRVVCGRGDTIASFWPTSRFSSVDLPAFGPPDQRHESGAMLAGRARARRAGPLAHRWSSPVHRRAGAPASRMSALAPVHEVRLDVDRGRRSPRDARVPWVTSRSSSSASGTPTRRACAPRRLGRDHDLTDELHLERRAPPAETPARRCDGRCRDSACSSGGSRRRPRSPPRRRRPATHRGQRRRAARTTTREPGWGPDAGGCRWPPASGSAGGRLVLGAGRGGRRAVGGARPARVRAS